MPWSGGVFSLDAAATDAFPGKVLTSSDWNTIFTEVIAGFNGINTSLVSLFIGTAETMVVHGVTVNGQLEINSSVQAIQELHTHSSDNSASTIYGAKSRGTLAAPTIVQSGDGTMGLYGLGYDGVDYEATALIMMAVDGTPGANDMPGRIEFYTTPDGSTTLTERLRINSDGQLIFAPGSVTPASLTTNSTYTLTPTSNTNFRISFRGTDGTTRVANITLA